MKERPILFSAPMVRAILEGRKAQTRLVVKDAPIERNGYLCTKLITFRNEKQVKGILPSLCPYGKPGDRLWVRETCRVAAWRVKEGKFAFDYKASPELIASPWVYPPDDGSFDRLLDQTTNQLSDLGVLPDEYGDYRWERGKSPCLWRASIHMPRWASRILLEITDVRVQRLQEISFEDVMAEGILGWVDSFGRENMKTIRPNDPFADEDTSAWPASIDEIADDLTEEVRYCYSCLWDTINGPDAWDANPWVWAITFKRTEAAERAE